MATVQHAAAADSAPMVAGQAPATSPAPSAMSQITMEASKAEVRRLLSRMDGDDNKIVQAADDLEDLFQRMGWLYHMHISPRQVGRQTGRHTCIHTHRPRVGETNT